MITGIDPYYPGIVSSSISDRSQHHSHDAARQPEHSRRFKVSDEGNSVRPVTPEADIKVSLSGSVIYEPGGVLADLSGVGRTQEAAQEFTRTPLPYNKGSQPSEVFLEIDEPVLHTFEIII